MYPPKKQKLSNFTYIFLSAGAGVGVVRVDHKKMSAGEKWWEFVYTSMYI